MRLFETILFLKTWQEFSNVSWFYSIYLGPKVPSFLLKKFIHQSQNFSLLTGSDPVKGVPEVCNIENLS